MKNNLQNKSNQKNIIFIYQEFINQTADNKSVLLHNLSSSMLSIRSLRFLAPKMFSSNIGNELSIRRYQSFSLGYFDKSWPSSCINHIREKLHLYLTHMLFSHLYGSHDWNNGKICNCHFIAGKPLVFIKKIFQSF